MGKDDNKLMVEIIEHNKELIEEIVRIIQCDL